MERATMELPIIAAMETPMAMRPPLVTRFIMVWERNTAAAVPAVATRLPPKYLIKLKNHNSRSFFRAIIATHMYVSWILVLTYSGHMTDFSTAPISPDIPAP